MKGGVLIKNVDTTGVNKNLLPKFKGLIPCARFYQVVVGVIGNCQITQIPYNVVIEDCNIQLCKIVVPSIQRSSSVSKQSIRLSTLYFCVVNLTSLLGWLRCRIQRSRPIDSSLAERKFCNNKKKMDSGNWNLTRPKKANDLKNSVKI